MRKKSRGFSIAIRLLLAAWVAATARGALAAGPRAPGVVAPRMAQTPASSDAGAPRDANAAFHADPNSGSFKIATFNILFANKDLKAIAAIIRKADADVVCLQETNDASERALREELRRVCPYASFHSGDYAAGLGFLSKAPLRNVKYLPPGEGLGFFGTYFCEANLAGAPVSIASVHLYPTVPPPGAKALEVLKLFTRAEEIRAKEANRLLAAYPTKLPRVLAGDFNALPGGTAPTLILGKGYLDSGTAGGGGAVGGGGTAGAGASASRPAPASAPAGEPTWNGTWNGLEARFRLDYIFHTKDLRATGCRVFPTDASDHALVVTTFRWSPATSQSATAGALPK